MKFKALASLLMFVAMTGMGVATQSSCHHGAICHFISSTSGIQSSTRSIDSTVTVVSTGDGDTLRVQNTGSPFTVQLGCIDAA